MFAASLLVVAVMATYASLAVMSLSGGGSLSFPTSLPGKVLTSLGNSVVGWHAPSAKDVLGVHDPSSSGSSQSVAFADSPYVNFGQVPTAGAAPAQISVTNTSSASLHLVLSVVNANGISATFDKTKTTQMVVHPHKPATINLTSDPLNAGPINGSLVVSIAKSGSTPLLIPLTGAQAPLASPSLTATPAANGAVNLAWAPSPSSGVSAYAVQRLAGTTGAWQTIATLPGTATSTVDQTGIDGSFTYRVIAEATTSLNAPLPGPAGPNATAIAVATPPAEPTDVGAPPFINAETAANGGGVNIPVSLLDSSSTDTITVTLTDKNGNSVSGQHSGGASSVTVNVPNVGVLADGKITVSATATDSLGNTSPPFTAAPPIRKDTVLPGCSDRVRLGRHHQPERR